MNQPLQEPRNNMKTKCAIIGSGKIGCDLLVKIKCSKYLECILMAGQREKSEGLKFAKEKGISISTKSIDAILQTDARIIFDATTAISARQNAQLLKDRFYIDLTPSKTYPICIPNITKASLKGVSMGSCTLRSEE